MVQYIVNIIRNSIKQSIAHDVNHGVFVLCSNLGVSPAREFNTNNENKLHNAYAVEH